MKRKYDCQPQDGKFKQEGLEIGTYIAMAPHPFIRTTVIKFVPRYFIVNKLDIPIVIKEKSFTKQVIVMNGDEVGFNMIGDEPEVLVRLVNCAEEF